MTLANPVRQLSQTIPLPAPTLGINAVDGLADMGPRDSIFSYNLYPSQYGLRVRNGYREHAINVGTDGGGRTIMPYIGSVDAENVLFATSQEGIFDITASGDTFTAAITFTTQDANSGYGQFTAYTTIGGHFLLYCDESNGYYIYTESTGTWAKIALGVGAGEVSGVDPGDLVSVINHKERLWFVEKDSANAWYLPAGQITGVATKFNFGSRFKKGGKLVNLYPWTVDGGSGIDDYLVAVSSSGDVIIFRGTDPDVDTDWFLQGTWYIGRPPTGRRIGGSVGGELYLLSTYGVLPVSRLLSGAVVQDQDTAVSKRITPLIQAQLENFIDTLGWEIQLIPSENLLLVSVPRAVGSADIQFVQAINTRAWGLYRNLPYYTGGEWNGDFYFADGEGKVYIHSGYADAVDLGNTTSEEVEFSLLTAFQDIPPVGHFKRVHFIRAVFLAQGIPGYDVSPRYDYQLEENDPVVATSSASGAAWDSAVWDIDIWGGGFTVTQEVTGGQGMGRAIAVALRGQTAVKTTLVSLAIVHDGGGIL